MSAKLDNTMHVKIEFVLIILFRLTFIIVIKYKFILKSFRYIEEFPLIFIFEKTYFTYLMFGNFCLKYLKVPLKIIWLPSHVITHLPSHTEVKRFKYEIKLKFV